MNCINCDRTIRHGYKQFCSLKCKTDFSFKEIKCEYCGNDFKKRKYEIKKTEHNFCSKNCWARFFYKKGGHAFSIKNKGKSYEKIHGKDKAIQLKKKLAKVHLGLQANEKHPLFLLLDEKKLIELYNEFKSVKYVAKILKCSPSAILRRLKKSKIELFKEVPIRDETRKKQSEAKLGKINYSRLNQKHTEATKKLIREWRKNFITPKKDTSIEVKIQNYLKELKIDFFTHQYVDIEHGYQCDFLIPSMNMIIETDGNYWHKYPIGNELDHIRTKELIEKGFKVLRLWESEIKVMDLNKFKERLNNVT